MDSRRGLAHISGCWELLKAGVRAGLPTVAVVGLVSVNQQPQPMSMFMPLTLYGHVADLRARPRGGPELAAIHIHRGGGGHHQRVLPLHEEAVAAPAAAPRLSVLLHVHVPGECFLQAVKVHISGMAADMRVKDGMALCVDGGIPDSNVHSLQDWADKAKSARWNVYRLHKKAGNAEVLRAETYRLLMKTFQDEGNLDDRE